MIRSQTLLAVIAACAALIFAAPAMAQSTPYGAPISLRQAETVLDAAMAEASSNDWNVAIAIVDGGGHLIAFKRMDSVSTVVADFAIGKARTAAALRAPSANGEGWLQNSPTTMPLTPFRGALPIIIDGRVIGAIGTSGVTSEQDEQISAAGIAALQP
jgi:glc operon protein GlcG